MSCKKTPPNLELSGADTPEATLVDRQRQLYAYAEEIEKANSEGKALRAELANWLQAALKNIACGSDAELCLGVKCKKTERRDGFLRALQSKHAQGLIAAATEKSNPGAVRPEEAFGMVEPLGLKASTARRKWNTGGSKRGKTYTLTEK